MCVSIMRAASCCSVPCGWFVFISGQYFCVNESSVDGASGVPWTAEGSLEFVLGACSDRGWVSLVGARGGRGHIVVLGRIMVWSVGD